MAFFGYPVAHDNDAERAARAGLAILEAIASLNEHRVGTKLSVRIGIDSGPVVVGAGAGRGRRCFRRRREYRGAGAGNGRARHRIGDGWNESTDGRSVHSRGSRTHISSRASSGRSTSILSCGRAASRGRFEAAAAAGSLTRFVGREDELRSLLSRWARARDGEGQVVMISGEAGIGKSRVVRRFREKSPRARIFGYKPARASFFRARPSIPSLNCSVN